MKYLFTLFLLFLPLVGMADESPIVVSCRVIDRLTQQPIPYASIYIKETKSGAVANEQGRLVLPLQEGRYQILVRSLGYQSLQVDVAVESGKAQEELLWLLSPTAYQLQEVEVTSRRGQEDPAYPIMRRVMLRTPIYDRLLQSYTSYTYTKGGFVLKSLPFFLKGVDADGVELKEYMGKKFVIESEVETRYKAPGEYVYHTRAMRSSIPEELSGQEGSTYMSVINGNIYSERIGMGRKGILPNPLRSQGLRLYDYRLVDTVHEGDQVYYRIAFKSKGDNATSGELLIAHNEWLPVKVTAHTSVQGMLNQDLKVDLHQVQPGLYLPTSFVLSLRNSIAGFEVDMDYFASNRYERIVLNHAIQKLLSSKQEDEKQLLISNKERFAQRNLTRSLISTERQMETFGYKVRDRFELPIKQEKIETSADSTALFKDSLYWSSVAKATLDAEELQSYRNRDSLMLHLKNKREEAKKETSSIIGDFAESLLLTGWDWKIGKHGRFGTLGLLTSVPKYRYTDGLWIGPTFDMSYASIWYAQMGVYYTTKRHIPYWNLQSMLHHTGLRRGTLEIRAGHESHDLSGLYLSGFDELSNTLYTLWDGRNNRYLYERKYLSFAHGLDLANGVRLILRGTRSLNTPLPDGRVWGIRKQMVPSALNFKAAQDPIPFPNYTMEAHRTTRFSVIFSFNTSPYYRIVNGRKAVLNQHEQRLSRVKLEQLLTPTAYSNEVSNALQVSLGYEQAFASLFSNDSRYGRLFASLYGGTSLSPVLSLHYLLQAAYYTHRDRLHPTDRVYLKRENGITANEGGELLFHTLPPYSSTGTHYVAGRTIISLPPLVSRVIPWNKRGNREMLTLKSYWDAEFTGAPFVEVGYSLWLRLWNVGVYYGAYGLRHHHGMSVRLHYSF